jgi:hypothetical protein
MLKYLIVKGLWKFIEFAFRLTFFTLYWALLCIPLSSTYPWLDWTLAPLMVGVYITLGVFFDCYRRKDD